MLRLRPVVCPQIPIVIVRELGYTVESHFEGLCLMIWVTQLLALIHHILQYSTYRLVRPTREHNSDIFCFINVQGIVETLNVQKERQVFSCREKTQFAREQRRREIRYDTKIVRKILKRCKELQVCHPHSTNPNRAHLTLTQRIQI